MYLVGIAARDKKLLTCKLHLGMITYYYYFTLINLLCDSALANRPGSGSRYPRTQVQISSASETN